MRHPSIAPRTGAALFVALALISTRVAAQATTPCHFICAPTVTVQLGMLRTHVASSPRVRSLSTGQVSRLPAHTNELVVFLVTAPTPIPRVGVLADVAWVPNAKRSANPFTEYTASEIGDQSIRANAPVTLFAATLDLLTAKQLDGWASLGVLAGDQFGPAARPDDRSTYTHKLDLQTFVTLLPFNSLVPKKTWLHGVSVVADLDYVATGLPRTGDEVPAGERVFLDDARSVNFSLVAGFPIAVPGS